MRFTGAVACIQVGTDCYDKAVGNVPQTLFAEPHIWLWWVVAALWLISGLQFVFSK
jgi:hypothetical protein